MGKVHEIANENESLNIVLDSLTLNQFYRENNINANTEIDKEKFKEAAWYASIISLSDKEEHKEKALAFAVLAYKNYPHDLNIARYCYVIFARIGNITLSQHIAELTSDEVGTFIPNFDSFLNFELNKKFESLNLSIGDKDFLVTLFQKDIWEKINNNKFVAISGPTSSGKSFMVQNYIIDKMATESKFRVLYIVPTRSLISEVSTKLRQEISNVKIRIGLGVTENESIDDKEIFVLTPERALKILELDNLKDFEINLVFFDEIQKLEDDERGVLFEFILNELEKRWTNCKFIIAGPYLKELEKTFKRLNEADSSIAKSFVPSVYQMKVILTYSKENKHKVLVTIKSPSGKNIKVDVDISTSLYGKLTNSNTREAVPLILQQFGSQAEDINIVYAPRRSSAETWACSFADYLKSEKPFVDSYELRELVTYLSDEVHPEYSLIRCLKKGIAFHHSSIPEIAKIEIEDLYKEEKENNIIIKTLFCTPTLLEGVNLPPNKMFIFVPKKDTITLETFEFGNLIGRVGRLESHLMGTVYCIEVIDDPWADKNLSADFTKEMRPATVKAFNEKYTLLLENIDKRGDEINDRTIAYTISLLRHKYIRNVEETKNYLIEKKISERDIKYIMDKLNLSLKDIKIPSKILILNPTIDPLLQDLFYTDIKKNGIEKWLVHNHPIYNSNEFYTDFLNVTIMLDDIFKILKEKQKGQDHFLSMSIGNLVRISMHWLRGYSYKTIIDIELKNPKNKKKIDSTIRDIIKNINDLVRFEMVKYYKLWSDVIGHELEKEKREKYKYFLGLPQMIEMGSCDPKALELMMEGINRSVAVKIVEQVPDKFEGPMSTFLHKAQNLNLSPLFKKHLKKQGY